MERLRFLTPTCIDWVTTMGRAMAWARTANIVLLFQKVTDEIVRDVFHLLFVIDIKQGDVYNIVADLLQGKGDDPHAATSYRFI